MFAESGAAPPLGIGTSTPEQVGKAVVRAIEHNKSEICVAPLRQRALARFAMLAPEMFGRAAGSAARSRWTSRQPVRRKSGKASSRLSGSDVTPLPTAAKLGEPVGPARGQLDLSSTHHYQLKHASCIDERYCTH